MYMMYIKLPYTTANSGPLIRYINVRKKNYQKLFQERRNKKL